MKPFIPMLPLSRIACVVSASLGVGVYFSALPLAYATETEVHSDTSGGTSPADGLKFDPSFLSKQTADQIDLSRFEHGASALPGDYVADIYVNDIDIGKNPITFQSQADKSVTLCLKPDVIRKLGLDFTKLPSDVRARVGEEGGECLPLNTVLPQVNPSYDSGTQRLDISVPQLYLVDNGRGYVSPELWDQGVPAAMLGYSSNFYSTHSRGKTYQSGYVGVNAGLNIGEWYFRHTGNYNWQNSGDSHYERINTYVQRDIAQIGGRLVLGESNTSGQVFDSLPFRGGELVDDDRMLPQSERGFAPEVRGIARTNAKVTVRQNGQIIYEKTVAPGAFDITDLYPTGYGGDLNVTVTEADGSTQTFSVPYASVSQLLRPGASHYDVVVGELNDSSVSGNPLLYQLAYQRGLTNLFTGYGGLQVSQNYYALQLGTALNTPVGAIAFDVTQARMHLDNDEWTGEGYDSSMSGQSYRVSYSKYINDTGSNLSIAAYRFSTSGYMDFLTAMETRDAIEHGDNPNNIYRPKNKLTVTANQELPTGWGQLYVSGYAQNYWNQDTGSDLQYQLGYSNSFHRISYSLNAGRSRNGEGKMENTFMLNLSVPLGSVGETNMPQLTASVSQDTSGTVGEQVGISGTGGKEHQFSYGVSGSNYNHGGGSSGTINGEYRSPYTDMSASASVGDGYHSSSAGLSGTIIGYQGGVVFTPYTGDTFAIVEAKGATGAHVGSYSGVEVDPWGHAAVPYLNAYEMNEVELDPKGLPDDVELEMTSQKVAPHAGAIVRLKYPTQHGYPVLISAHTAGNQTIPFGAEVRNSHGDVVGNVGQGSVIYARVEELHDSLKVKWGSDASHQCQVSYMLPPQQKNTSSKHMNRFNSVCQ